MMRIQRAAIIATAVIIAYTGTGAAAPTAPTTWYVAQGAGTPQCRKASSTNPFGTITAALNCAANGDTISIGAGAFTENVALNKNVALVGAGISATTVQLPSSSQDALFRIPVGVSASMSNLTASAYYWMNNIENRGSLTLTNVDVFGGSTGIATMGSLMYTGGSVTAAEEDGIDVAGAIATVGSNYAGVTSSTASAQLTDVIISSTDLDAGLAVETMGGVNLARSAVGKNAVGVQVYSGTAPGLDQYTFVAGNATNCIGMPTGACG